MNKQEALKQIEEQRDMILELHGWGVFGYIKGIINQLDEPQKIELPKVDFKKFQKVKVPQFVADWIEEKRDMGWKLTKMVLQANLNEQYWRWVVDNQETFARAWLDGYEVEKEKRYRVRFKGLDKDLEYLNFKHGHVWLFSYNIENEEYRTAHTRKELENADFSWVFNCEGIEIEEVE